MTGRIYKNLLEETALENENYMVSQFYHLPSDFLTIFISNHFLTKK